MRKLARSDLMSLETYAERRAAFRADVLARKRDRSVRLGEHVTLIFEDRLTIQYQVQEMLRVERIFEVEGIEDELQAYNPLIPDGTNLKATMMIEYPDVDQRKAMLARLIGIEDRVWMQVAGFDRVYAIADEDMERDTEEKTSAVHFMRLEFDEAMIAALREGAALALGVDHPQYRASVDALPEAVRASLVRDFA